MRILGIETSTSVISVAVGEDMQILGESLFKTKQAHMEKLLPLIEYVLGGLGFALCDMDGFAVAAGPGSFTSLRVGIATAEAFAHALAKPVVGVPTLDALAWALRGVEGLICPVLPARSQEVYASFYVSDDRGMKRLSSYLAVNPLDLIERLQSELRARITFTGEGAQTYWDIIKERLGERAVLAETPLLLPRAGFVVKLGCSMLQNQENRDGRVKAIYVKPPAIRGK